MSTHLIAPIRHQNRSTLYRERERDSHHQSVMAKKFYGVGARLANWMEMYRDRKAAAAASSRAPFKAQNNFQLRVRKNAGPQQQQQQLLETGTYQGMRVRKAILQEIRDRRRSMADHSNSNFQLRVRKSQERGFGPGQNFQLRVRRSA